MAAKIKDGLFLGDADCSASEVFINDNKISNLINLAGREVQNVWASHGLVYLTYYWEDRPDYRLFTGHEDGILGDIVEFIDVSLAHGISVLLFSRKGTGRCVVAVCVYLMMKYRWGFEKTYDFVYSKKPDIELNKGFIQQMFALDMKLLAARQRAYALKHRITSEFKIEANMTINDIAAMLPTNEAKRWNAWDPDYLVEKQSESDEIEAENKDSEAKFGSNSYDLSMKRKNQLHSSQNQSQSIRLPHSDDVEDELNLIHSFINSKNTITALPGPYRNAYEIPKHFKLRFDNICQEEDIHMFPTSPGNPRYTQAPVGVLKGGSRHKSVFQSSNGSSKQHIKNDHKESSHHSGSANKSIEQNGHSKNKNNNTDYLISDIYPSESDDANGYNKYNSQTQPNSVTKKKSNNGFDMNNNNNTIASSDTKNDAKNDNSVKRSNDLYGFVGMTHPSPTSPTQNPSITTNAPISAEERLRKLMADMQRQHKPNSISNNNTTTATTQSPPNNNTYHNNKKEEEDLKSSSRITNVTTTSGVNAAVPSLYDLANMKVSNNKDKNNDNNNNNLLKKNSTYNNSNFDEDDLSTSLLLGPTNDNNSMIDDNNNNNPNNNPNNNNQRALTKGGGAIRARHDILTNSLRNSQQNNNSNNRQTPNQMTQPPPTAKIAWGGNNNNNNSSIPTRYSSPNNNNQQR
eukprot:gene12713-17049_t